MRLITTLASLLALSGGAAQAITLDFGSSGAPNICSSSTDGLGSAVVCGSGAYLLQSYGDVAGIVDVSFSAPRIASPTSLKWWSTDYNNLYGVAWADGGDGNSRARIELKAVDPGALVTLAAFDLGAWANTSRTTTVNVYALGGGAPLFTYAGSVGEAGNQATHFSPANASAVGGLWIEWQDSAYNVGIDNIQYSVSGVPEPGAVALMLAGLGVVGTLARRRRG